MMRGQEQKVFLEQDFRLSSHSCGVRLCVRVEYVKGAPRTLALRTWMSGEGQVEALKGKSGESCGNEGLC